MMTKKERQKKYRELWASETEETKACSKCLLIKPISEFTPQSSGRRGLQSKCRACYKKYDRKYRCKSTEYLKLRDLEPLDKKVCKNCLKMLPIAAFHANFQGHKGVKPVCKECSRLKYTPLTISQKRRARSICLKKKYGITIEDYDRMLESQNGRCTICGTKTPGGSGCFHIDHDHETNQVRALLCSKCNQALGLFQDDPTICLKAAEYLEKYTEVTV